MRLTQGLCFKMLRRHVFFNNEYQLGRLRVVKNRDIRQSLEERGIAVAEPQVSTRLRTSTYYLCDLHYCS